MQNAIQGLDRVSTPGLRKYAGVGKVPKVMSGMGIGDCYDIKGRHD